MQIRRSLGMATCAALLSLLEPSPASASPEFFKSVRKDDVAKAARILDDSVGANVRTAALYHVVSPEMVQLLVASGVDLEAVIRDDRKALHWAAEMGKIDVARALIDAGAQIEGRSRGARNTPLMIAARHSKLVMAEMLVEAGADVNVGNAVNFTALHWAAKYSGAAMIDLLLDAGANPLARESYPGHADDGFRPLDAARKYNPRILRTDAGRRLHAATRRVGMDEPGCDGVVVQPSDTKLSYLAERALGKASRWKEIAQLNGLDGKGYRAGDCLALP